MVCVVNPVLTSHISSLVHGSLTATRFWMVMSIRCWWKRSSIIPLNVQMPLLKCRSWITIPPGLSIRIGTTILIGLRLSSSLVLCTTITWLCLVVVRKLHSVSLPVTSIRQVLLSSRSSSSLPLVWCWITMCQTVSVSQQTLPWHIPIMTRTIRICLVLHRTLLRIWVSIVRMRMVMKRVSIISWMSQTRLRVAVLLISIRQIICLLFTIWVTLLLSPI